MVIYYVDTKQQNAVVVVKINGAVHNTQHSTYEWLLNFYVRMFQLLRLILSNFYKFSITEVIDIKQFGKSIFWVGYSLIQIE